jgi:hypothetical protein
MKTRIFLVVCHEHNHVHKATQKTVIHFVKTFPCDGLSSLKN